MVQSGEEEFNENIYKVLLFVGRKGNGIPSRDHGSTAEKHLRKLEQVRNKRGVSIVTCNSVTHLLFFRATWSILCAVKSLSRVQVLYPFMHTHYSFTTSL